MEPYYPPVGFHFEVAFEGFNASTQDTRFQHVSGLSVTVETESIQEGGENRFVHKLPTGMAFEDLQLKRGLCTDSELITWCRDAVEGFTFRPANLTISLLDETHSPVAAWHVVHAIPVHWELSELDSAESRAVIESLKLQYRYFTALKV